MGILIFKTKRSFQVKRTEIEKKPFLLLVIYCHVSTGRHISRELMGGGVGDRKMLDPFARRAIRPDSERTHTTSWSSPPPLPVLSYTAPIDQRIKFSGLLPHYSPAGSALATVFFVFSRIRPTGSITLFRVASVLNGSCRLPSLYRQRSRWICPVTEQTFVTCKRVLTTCIGRTVYLFSVSIVQQSTAEVITAGLLSLLLL